MDIIGIDSSCVDHIVSIDRMPYKDEEITMYRQSWQGGGKVATALVAASRLGAKTGLMGIIGDDGLGAFLKQDLQEDGVDVSKFLAETGKTSDYCISLAEKQTGGRSFIVEWGNHRAFQQEDLDPSYIGKAKCLHLYTMDTASVAAARMAKEQGLSVAFDADAYSEEIMENICLIDYFIGSEFFYNALFHEGNKEENCARLLKKGPKAVIFTFGGDGCVGAWSGGTFQIPAYRVTAIDTTGAGDTFHGAFLYAAVCEKMDPVEAARFASAVAAMKCMHLGGRAGLPTREMVAQFMKTGEYDLTPSLERQKKYASFYTK